MPSSKSFLVAVEDVLNPRFEAQFGLLRKLKIVADFQINIRMRWFRWHRPQYTTLKIGHFHRSGIGARLDAY